MRFLQYVSSTEYPASQARLQLAGTDAAAIPGTPITNRATQNRFIGSLLFLGHIERGAEHVKTCPLASDDPCGASSATENEPSASDSCEQVDAYSES
jgi:hypothetical protein